MLGQYVNNYEIIGLIGEGGMGAVYAAQHQLIGRRVAIKVLKRDLASEPDVVQRFFNEARAIGALRHPNIIEIIDVGMLPGSVPFLVMELLHGESLSERMARLGPLPFDVAVDFVSQAAIALEVAHEHGVVHRDLKPENLFIVTDDGQREVIKVLDFGIAKLRDDLTATPVRTRAGSLLGTPLYMSPEQCRGLDELDLRTDVYSLGVILYEAVGGAPPFLAKSIGEVMRMHMFDAPELPSCKRSGVPAQVEHVILKCLAKSPDERFSNMFELQHALEQSGLATTEPDTPMSSLRGSSYAQGLARRAPSSLGPVVRRDQAQTARAGRLGSSHLALWTLVLSLVALGVPDERLPTRGLRARVAANVLQLPAAVVMAPLRMAAALVPVLGAAAPDRSAERAAVPASGARHVTGQGGGKASRVHAPIAMQPTAAALGSEGTASMLRAAQAVANAEPSPAATASGMGNESPQPGFLSLDSAPWAEVFLGNQALGTTPLIHVALPPGRHQLTLRNAELEASTTYVVEIKSGQSLARLVGWGR